MDEADYLNIGRNSGMNLIGMQAYVWVCVCVCVCFLFFFFFLGGGGVGFFVCMCLWGGGLFRMHVFVGGAGEGCGDGVRT